MTKKKTELEPDRLKSSRIAELTMSELGLPGSEFDMQLLLNPVFPAPTWLPDGSYYFEPDQVRWFDALFERFGIEFRSSDDKFDDLKYLTELWYRLSNTFGSHIEASKMLPKAFTRKMASWSPDFQRYLQAVMDDDKATARELAKKLQIEDLNAPMPRAFFG